MRYLGVSDGESKQDGIGTDPPSRLWGAPATLLDRAEHSVPVRWMRIIEPFAVVLAIVAFWFDLQSRDEARVVAAWQLATTKASGNSGKVEALTYLKDRTSLAGVDVSPPEGAYARAVLRNLDVSGADLSGANFSTAELSGSDFSGATLDGANFERTTGQRVNLDSSTFDRLNLKNVEMRQWSIRANEQFYLYPEYVVVEGAEIFGSDLQGRRFILVGDRPVFFQSKVADTCLITAAGVREPPRGYVWAPSDNPAIGLPPTLAYFECTTDAPAIQIVANFVWKFDYAPLAAGLVDFASKNEQCVRKPPPQAPDTCSGRW